MAERSNPGDDLKYAESILENDDPGVPIEERIRLYVDAVRAVRSMPELYRWLAYDEQVARNCTNLGLDFETLESINGAFPSRSDGQRDEEFGPLQQPFDSDIT